VAIDVEEEFRRGGPVALAFLTYCVMAYRLEPVLAWIVRDYRLRPTAPGALAIWDSFLAPQAPARLRHAPPSILPPRDLRLGQEMKRIRALSAAGALPLESPLTVEEGEPERAVLPIPPLRVPAPAHLFDPVISGLREGEGDLVLLPGEGFDPALTPEANLPGGRMGPGQRAWVERTWQKGVRPRLVGAGFWRVATVA
jgi:hypothetical protein